MSSNPNYDSEFCGKVPIHLINTVQPYGALLVLSRPDLEIIQTSENASAIFDKNARELIRTPIAGLLDDAALSPVFIQDMAADSLRHLTALARRRADGRRNPQKLFI